MPKESRTTTMLRRAVERFVTDKLAAKAADDLATASSKEALDAYEYAQETTIDVQVGGASFKCTRVDGTSITLDAEELEAILTPAQRRAVIKRTMVEVVSYDEDALNDLINRGKIVPNTIPYKVKAKSPYIKVTAVK